MSIKALLVAQASAHAIAAAQNINVPAEENTTPPDV
jgi:hypothetical protein